MIPKKVESDSETLFDTNYLAVQCCEFIPMFTRQWPEVYDLCHTFFHVARLLKPTAMRESRDSRMAVGFLTRATCKNV